MSYEYENILGPVSMVANNSTCTLVEFWKREVLHIAEGRKREVLHKIEGRKKMGPHVAPKVDRKRVLKHLKVDRERVWKLDIVRIPQVLNSPRQWNTTRYPHSLSLKEKREKNEQLNFAEKFLSWERSNGK